MSAALDPVSRLSQHSTSIVSDALDELGIHGVLQGIHAQRIGQSRVAGLALPVWFKPKAHDPDAYDPELSKAEASKRIDELKHKTGR